jgi:superoxide dismutase
VNPLNNFSSSLRYDFSALEPVLSRETVQYHFIQHHRRCYERTAALVKGTELQPLPLESLVRITGNRSDLLLAGAFCHARLREKPLGGVTRIYSLASECLF